MPDLFTIGYEGNAQAAVIKTLLFHDIQSLVDIRELPQSRKPGMSKTGLGIAAADNGIQYTHMRTLGTPRDIRYRRKIDHDQPAFERAYVDYLERQADAMHELMQRAFLERCCLLCYEADPRICHRWLVAERAHALTDGALTPVHLDVMAVNSSAVGDA